MMINIFFIGKGPSVWDTFCHEPSKIDDKTTCEIACDSYHKYKEDVRLLKEMGVSFMNKIKVSPIKF